jgi:transglutaminase-like putative cysteine protease
MKLPRHHSKRKELAQYLLLGVPTMLLMAFGIYLANQWLSVLSNHWITQTIAFAAGLSFAIWCFARRLRFITLSLGIIGIYALLKFLSQLVLPNEYDAFFFIIRANNFFTLFAAGWAAGYGFSRSRFFTVFWSVCTLAALLMVIASITPPLRSAIIFSSVPVLAYMAYIIYTGEFIRNMNEDQTGFKWFVLRRLITFGILISLVLGFGISLLKPDFTTIEKEWENGGKPKENNERQNSLTRNDGMGTSMQTSMGLQGFNNRANKDSVLFVAKLENYFPDGETPNPLYFVSDYYTLFDTITQTFETDTLRPYNDLFQPDLLSLPLYFKAEDTVVIGKSLSNLNRSVATAEVYKTQLSPRHFTAPSTAFFVQPISVPEENKDIYKSAYRTKMLVSDLNSAYFVYNPAGDPGLELFQEQRFTALRTIEDYRDAPADFMQYYTQMPVGASYDSIRMLAQSIADSATVLTPIDRMIAIRDFFLATDSSGNPTFKYSDNPGIPGLPSANKLCYFLFDSKKGYCAYYAGATLFLLRAMGIPSRIATGFLTVDRSNKNPGWYWFYEDQAHAWVQVWFPGYGWLDFDTTVPSAESQESPQPDQTPPLTSQTAWLVANGKVTSVDTVTRRLRMKVTDILYWDQPWHPKTPQEFDMDISLARVLRDTGQVGFDALKAGMDIVAVSFSEQFKELPPEEGEKWESLYKRWPAPLPVDEIKIIAPEEEKKASAATKGISRFSIYTILVWIAWIAGILIVAALLFPLACYNWFSWMAKRAGATGAKAYYSYMASLLYLHQLGYRRGALTPVEFAKQKADPAFGTTLTRFIQVYQKIKYSRHPLSAAETDIVNQQHPAFVNKVKAQVPFKKRFIRFLNTEATLEFFTQPNILGSTKKT